MTRTVVAFDSAITIDRPVADVFALLTDPERTSRWSSLTTGETLITPRPVGVGSVYRVVTKGVGRSSERENVVTDFELDRRWSVRSLSGSPATRASASFKPVDGGTRVDFTLEAELSGLLRVVAPLARVIGKWQWDRDLRRLKTMMEVGTL